MPRAATDFEISRSRSGNYIDQGSAAIDNVMDPTDQSIEINVTSVSAFAAERGIEQIDIMKVDAEFQDLAVLQGAGDFLTSGRIHYLLVEEPPQDAAYSAGIVDLLRSAGYSLHHIVRRQPQLVADLARYPYDRARAPLNVLAVSPQAPVQATALGLDIL